MSVQSRRTDLSHGLDGVLAVDVVHVHREGGGGELAHAIMSSYQNQITSVKTLLTGLIKKRKENGKQNGSIQLPAHAARRGGGLDVGRDGDGLEVLVASYLFRHSEYIHIIYVYIEREKKDIQQPPQRPRARRRCRRGTRRSRRWRRRCTRPAR